MSLSRTRILGNAKDKMFRREASVSRTASGESSVRIMGTTNKSISESGGMNRYETVFAVSFRLI